MKPRALFAFLCLLLVAVTSSAAPSEPVDPPDLAPHYKEWREYYAKFGVLLEAKPFDGAISRLRASPDGKTLLAAGPLENATLLDAATLKLVRTFKGHKKNVVDAVYSPDGKLVLTASDDNTARLWETDTGKEVGLLEGHAASVCAVVFSPDGAQCATGSMDKTVRCWDVKLRKQIGKFLNEPSRWDEEDKTEAGGIISLAWSPDGSRIIAGSSAGERQTLLPGKRLSSVASGYSSDKPRYTRVLFTPNNSHQITLERNEDAKSGSIELNFAGFGVGTSSGEASTQNDILDIAPHFSGRFVAALAPDAIELYELDVKPPKRDGKFYSRDRLTPFAALKAKNKSLVVGVFSVDGFKFFAATNEGSIQAWGSKDEVPSQLPLPVMLKRSKRDLNQLPEDKQADSETLSDPAYKDWIDFYKSMHLSKTSTFRDPLARSIEFSNDGTSLLVSSGNDALLLSAETLKPVRTISGHAARVNDAAFSPDGKFAATASADKSARLFDAATAEEIRKFDGHNSEVTIVAFSPDGKKVATGSEGHVGIFDVESGKSLAWGKFEHRDYDLDETVQSRVLSLAWSPSSDRVYTAGTNGLLMAFDLKGREQNLIRYVEDINVFFVGLCHNEGLRITAMDNGSIQVDGEDRNKHRSGYIEGPYEISAVALSPNQKFLLVVGSNNKLRVHPLRVPEQKEIASGVWSNAALGYCVEIDIPQKHEIAAIAVSRDSRIVAALDTQGRIMLWSSKSEPPKD